MLFLSTSIASGRGKLRRQASATRRVGVGLAKGRTRIRSPAPERRVGLAWRRSFPRPEAIEVLRKSILACNLPQVEKLHTA